MAKMSFLYFSLIGLVVVGCARNRPRHDPYDCSASAIDSQEFEIISRDMVKSDYFHARLSLESLDKSQREQVLKSNLEKLENRIANLKGERSLIEAKCGQRPNLTSKLDAHISGVLENRTAATAVYERLEAEDKSNAARKGHFGNEEYSYSDEKVSVGVLDVVEFDELGYTEITLKLSALEKTRIVPILVVHKYSFNNSQGGISTARVVRGIRISDEYNNDYEISSDPTDIDELSPDKDELFKFMVKTPLRAAKFLVFSVDADTFGNAEPFVLKVQRLEPVGNK